MASDLSEKLAAKDIEGRGLSKNDFTDQLKGRVDIGVRPHTAYKFLQDLKYARRDVNVIIAGDSTSTMGGSSGSSNGGWSYQFFQKLAPHFPNKSFLYRPSFNAATGSFGGTQTIQTGSSGLSCTIYNTGVGGTTPTYPIGSQNIGSGYFNPNFGRESCDLILWCFGFNMNLTGPDRNIWSVVAQQYASLSQLMAMHPKAGVVIMEQWPMYGTVNGDMNTRACRELANLLNATLIETESKFLSDGKPASYYFSTTVGEVHLSVEGYNVVSTIAIERLLNANVHQSVLPSSLFTQSSNIITNGQFDNFSGGVITGFTNSNVTLAENTTDYLTGSRSIVATIGSNSASYIECQIANPGILNKISRKPITISADIRLPATGNNNSLCVLYASYNGVAFLGQTSHSGVSGVVDIGGYNWTKKALTYNMAQVTNTSTPLIIRFYFQAGVGTPSGAGLNILIDNLKLDIGDKVLGF